MMKVIFLGALEQVTGSATLLEYKDIQILVDFGYEQGEDPVIDCDPFKSIDITKLKAVFLTHAHLDHCGMIPILYQNGYKGKVFATKATSELAPHILRDCAKLGAPYDNTDIDKIQWYWPDMSSTFDWQKEIPLTSDGLSYYFQPTGHIVGAVSIGFVTNKSENSCRYELLFSGDLGYNFADQTANLLNSETMLPRPSVTHIVCESTYGDRCRSSKEKSYQNRLNNLKHVLKTTVMEKPCRLLIPAFSMHRTQELILDTYIAAKELQTPMYGLDSENQEGKSKGRNSIIELKINTFLGDNISRVYKKRLTDFIGKKFGNYKNLIPGLIDILELTTKEAHTFLSNLFDYSGSLQWSHKTKNYKHVGDGFSDNVLNIALWDMTSHQKVERVKRKSQLVIASSGMMSDGPMKLWMKSVLEDPNTYIAVTGYQAEGTIGKKLVDMIEHDQDDFISLGNRIYTKDDIQCKLVHLNGYSGHADQKDLLRWATGNFSDSDKIPRKLILNHGTNTMRESLAEAWREETGQQAIIPTRNKPTIAL